MLETIIIIIIVKVGIKKVLIICKMREAVYNMRQIIIIIMQLLLLADKNLIYIIQAITILSK